MYLSDYYYAADASGATTCYVNTACLNWLTDASNKTCTMIRTGQYSTGLNFWWLVHNTGDAGNNSTTYEYALRPVFYLESNVQYIGEGTGEYGSPLQIA